VADSVNKVAHEPCPECGSKDNLARYDDGHGYCFGCKYYEAGDGVETSSSRVASDWAVSGEIVALLKRGIREDTCTKWRYEKGHYHGKSCHIANYIKNNRVVAQKLRFADKSMTITGDAKAMGLYGEWLWRDGGKQVVVTEGEIDALTMSQLNGNKWPVVSVPNGAQSAPRAIASSLEWLEKFEKVIFMFDMDEPGQKAAVKCALKLSPGKAFIATLPAKDPSEALQKGKSKELLDAMWGAREYRPDGIVSVADVREEALRPATWGVSWPWEELTALTYGIRPKECIAIGAGTGVGKTDFMLEVAQHLIKEHNAKVAGFWLEQPVVETIQRTAGKLCSKLFHVPDAGWTEEELVNAINELAERNQLYLYDHFGSTAWDTIKSRMRYVVQALGVKYVFLDHLTALAAHADDERRALESIMADLSKLTQELDFTLFFVSHLATPEGKPHEEGGRVTIRHFKGSRAIGFWSHYMFGLERNQQSDDEATRATTTFRVLKDRYTGRATGERLYFQYDQETGRLRLCDECPFGDETNEGGDF